jgi:hypothetical protein
MIDSEKSPFIIYKNGEDVVIKDSNDVEKDKIQIIVLENYFFVDYIEFLKKNQSYLQTDISFYDKIWKYDLVSIDHYNFSKIPLNYILLLDRENSDSVRTLIGTGVTTTIFWNGENDDLPEGWRGSVRRSFMNSLENKSPNTLVGLGITIEDAYKRHGWAEKVIGYMKVLSAILSLKKLIIPLMPPKRYLLEYASIPFEEFASLKREDSTFEDHWIRLHVKVGAKVLKYSSQSHRAVITRKELISSEILPSRIEFIMLDNVKKKPSIEHFSHTGEYLIYTGDRWYKIYVNAELDFILIDQGGVWVEHTIP